MSRRILVSAQASCNDYSFELAKAATTQSQEMASISTGPLTLTRVGGSASYRYMRLTIFQAQAAFLCVIFLSSCASLDAGSAISDGSQALEQAKLNEASTYARYKYAKASMMLDAAKERNGYGEYRIARVWADKAKALASEAQQTAKIRKNMEDRKKRIKEASQKNRKVRSKKKKTTSKRPTKKANTNSGERKRLKLLPPPRTKRKLLPPKRTSEELL